MVGSPPLRTVPGWRSCRSPWPAFPRWRRLAKWAEPGGIGVAKHIIEDDRDPDIATGAVRVDQDVTGEGDSTASRSLAPVASDFKVTITPSMVCDRMGISSGFICTEVSDPKTGRASFSIPAW